MGFVVVKTDKYFWPVTIETPVDGRTDKETFDGQFVRVSQSRIEEIFEQSTNGELKDRDIAAEILVGWKGITDDKREEVPFSITQRDELLDLQGFATAVVKAWFESLQGAKRKN